MFWFESNCLFLCGSSSTPPPPGAAKSMAQKGSFSLNIPNIGAEDAEASFGLTDFLTGALKMSKSLLSTVCMQKNASLKKGKCLTKKCLLFILAITIKHHESIEANIVRILPLNYARVCCSALQTLFDSIACLRCRCSAKVFISMITPWAFHSIASPAREVAHPGLIPPIAATIAELHGVSLEEVYEQTRVNTQAGRPSHPEMMLSFNALVHPKKIPFCFWSPIIAYSRWA